VLSAHQAELQVEDAYASALGTVPLGLIATYRALGGGWQSPSPADRVPEKVKLQMSERTNWDDLLRPSKDETQSPLEERP